MSGPDAHRPLNLQVLGVDLGSHESGLALLDIPRVGMSTLLAKGNKDVEGTLETLTNEAPTLDLVVLEKPLKVHANFIKKKGWAAGVSVGNAIADAREVCGQLKERCRALGLPFVEMGAGDWRAIECWKSNATDLEVMHALSMKIDWCGQTNEHVRDAAGAALAGGHMVWRGQTKIPSFPRRR